MIEHVTTSTFRAGRGVLRTHCAVETSDTPIAFARLLELCREHGFEPDDMSLEIEHEVDYGGERTYLTLYFPTEKCAFCNERRARHNGEIPAR